MLSRFNLKEMKEPLRPSGYSGGGDRCKLVHISQEDRHIPNVEIALSIDVDATYHKNLCHQPDANHTSDRISQEEGESLPLHNGGGRAFATT